VAASSLLRGVCVCVLWEHRERTSAAQSAGRTAKSQVGCRTGCLSHVQYIVRRVGIGAGPTKLQQVVEVGGERGRGGERRTSRVRETDGLSQMRLKAIYGAWGARSRVNAALSSVDVTSVTAERALRAGDWPWRAERDLALREG
jgi:hypothetical protein